jgi:uncharacterized damage-inducible protein DinB
VSQLHDAIRCIQETSKSMVDLVRDLPKETVVWKPSPEIWSILEILCHVEEAVPYWAYEIQRVAADPGAEWGRGHQNEARLAAVALSTKRKTAEVLAGIEEGTKRAVEALGMLQNEDLKIESPSRNPRFGTRPMAFVLDHLLVAHIGNHLAQIQRNINQFAATKGMQQ